MLVTAPGCWFCHILYTFPHICIIDLHRANHSICAERRRQHGMGVGQSQRDRRRYETEPA